MKSEDITIAFAANDADWDMVPYRFSATEKANLANCCTFHLSWDWGGTELSAKVIKSWEIIYDGVATFEDEDGGIIGLFLKGNKLMGEPRPIVRFRLSQRVKVGKFCQAVWGSGVNISSAYQKSKGSTGCSFVDANGSTHALPPAEAKATLKFFKAQPFYRKREFKRRKPNSPEDSGLDMVISLG
jgi:hypothetical protein